MSNKVFNKEELDKLNKYQLMDERRDTERAIQKQIQLLHKFGKEDKYYEQRNRHINLLYEKRSYIEKKLYNLKKKQKVK